jgi:branched-chain amino acid aminotransferase
MNGKIVDWADATIHAASHVIHYGSAVFEGARCYKTPKGSAFFRLDAHMRRLYDSARIYRMDYALDQPTLTKGVVDTVKANDLEITKEGNAIVISFAYRKEVPLFTNVGLYIDYAARAGGQ